MNTSKEIEARSDRGLEILKDAFNRGEMVLEFRRQEDGSISIIPIGDHVKELERENRALRTENKNLKEKLND